MEVNKIPIMKNMNKKKKKSNKKKIIKTDDFNFQKLNSENIKNNESEKFKKNPIILDHINHIRDEIKKKELKLTFISNVANDKPIFIDEEIVVNRNVYEVIGEELKCPICNGLLFNPVSCLDCETCFCKHCIENWIVKNNQCVMKCLGPFKYKEINRITKNIFEKLLLFCSTCGEEISLLKFPSHVANCKNEITRKNILNEIKFQEFIANILNETDLPPSEKHNSQGQLKNVITKMILEHEQTLPYCGHSSNEKNVLCKMCKKDDKMIKMETILNKLNDLPQLTKNQILLGVKEMNFCGICIEPIKRDCSSIQCSVCFSIKHYKCIIKHGDIDYCDCGWCNNATIKCTTCMFHFWVRDCIGCYCGRNFFLSQKRIYKAYGVISTLEEKLSGYSNQGIEIPLTDNNITKSCGLICGKALCNDKVCGLICHPGPHINCREHSTLKCYCGKKTKADRVCTAEIDKRILSCDSKCGFVICQIHSTKCERNCHSNMDFFLKKILPNDGHDSRCHICENEKEVKIKQNISKKYSCIII